MEACGGVGGGVLWRSLLTAAMMASSLGFSPKRLAFLCAAIYSERKRVGLSTADSREGMPAICVWKTQRGVGGGGEHLWIREVRRRWWWLLTFLFLFCVIWNKGKSQVQWMLTINSTSQTRLLHVPACQDVSIYPTLSHSESAYFIVTPVITTDQPNGCCVYQYVRMSVCTLLSATVTISSDSNSQKRPLHVQVD